jgi:ubiquinone/menaquinone biosynthesis C-methylase UbiE
MHSSSTCSSSTFLATDGAGYDLQMGRWSRRLAALLIDFAGVPESGRVLDVGCGTGSLTFALADRLREGTVTGVDRSSAYIAHATSRCRDPRVCFEAGDATDLHFDDQSFDHTLSSLVLQFIPGPDHAVRQMRRVTRSGGTVAAATWDTRGGVVARRMFFDTAAVIDPDAARRRAFDCARVMSSKSGLAKAWSDAGLVDIEVGSLTIRMDYVSFLDFWSSIDGRDGPIAAYLNSVNTETKITLRRLVEAAYLDGEPDGPRSYAATAWAVKGRVP